MDVTHDQRQTEPADDWRPGFQPAFQGLRAVAVLAVVAYHLGVLPEGWLGVEVFFVLSGFIITVPMLYEWHEGNFSFRRFYLRRTARLLPAAAITVAAALCFAVVVDLSVSMHVRAALASLLYHANLVMATGGEMGLMGHIWSLSLEEQFYLLWPMVLVAALRRGGVRWVAGVALTGFLTSAFMRAILTLNDNWYDRIYYGIDTRSGALLAGCLAGCAVFHSRGRAANLVPAWLLWVLTGIVLLSLVFLDGEAESTWVATLSLFDILVAVLLIGLYDRRHSVARMLGWRPVVMIGDMSYSIYLWQLPAIAATGFLVQTTSIRMGLQVTLPFVFAAISYYALEQPIRAWAKARTTTASPRRVAGIDPRPSSTMTARRGFRRR